MSLTNLEKIVKRLADRPLVRAFVNASKKTPPKRINVQIKQLTLEERQSEMDRLLVAKAIKNEDSQEVPKRPTKPNICCLRAIFRAKEEQERRANWGMGL